MAGRGQLKWGDIGNLETAIDGYFDNCKETGEAPNVAGLCLSLKIGRETFNYYANGRYEHRLAVAARDKKQELIESIGEDAVNDQTTENDIYEGNLPSYYIGDRVDTTKAQVSAALKCAKTRLESWNWDIGYKLKNPAMAIFALKAAFGYTDQPQDSGQHLHQNNLQINIKIDQNPANTHVIDITDA